MKTWHIRGVIEALQFMSSSVILALCFLQNMTRKCSACHPRSLITFRTAVPGEELGSAFRSTEDAEESGAAGKFEVF